MLRLRVQLKYRNSIAWSKFLLVICIRSLPLIETQGQRNVDSEMAQLKQNWK